jgi:hypothetical protein
LNKASRKEFYRKSIINALPRILSELDRDPLSYTYGSFDREYWAWATKDFSNTDLQRAVYPLALLYLNSFEGNFCYMSTRIKDYVLAGVRYLELVQHSDGSFDHHYPNEKSFVAVAFPLYEVAQAYLELDAKGALTQQEKKLFVKVMSKAAGFLLKVDEGHGFISNHRLGAACALYSSYLIFKDDRYRQRAEFFVSTVKNRRSQSEGWLCEYGGADPGYQTLDTYYAANYYRLSGDKTFLDEVIIPSVKFLTYFLHPDGSIGGEYGSRNSPLFFPSGFELLSTRVVEAETIISFGAEALSNEHSPGLLSYDLRNFVPMLSSYIQAFFQCSAEDSGLVKEPPYKGSFERYWPGAGILVYSNQNFYVILGLSKGGVLKVFDKNRKKLLFSHSGYTAQEFSGAAISTQFLNWQYSLHRQGPGGCSFDTNFFEYVPKRVMTQFKFLLFRIFTFTLGRVRAVNYFVRKHLITGIFIHRKKAAPFTLRRSVNVFTDRVELCDDFSLCAMEKLQDVHAGDFFTTIYMASTKYYRHSENQNDVLGTLDLKQNLKEKNKIIYKITPQDTQVLFK